jgi:hypothetical protein
MDRYILISDMKPKFLLVIQVSQVYGEMIIRCFANISLVDFLLKVQQGGIFSLQLYIHETSYNYITIFYG